MIEAITLEIDLPAGEYEYLAGPMTDYPKHNFPRFEEVAGKLRANGRNICTPHELDDPGIVAQVYASVRGDEEHLSSQSPLGHELLRRDVNIVMHPRCVGVICLEGWEDSFGAQIETFIASRWERPIHLYSEDENGDPVLTYLPDRDCHLRQYEAAKAAAKGNGKLFDLLLRRAS
jgi:hypothetical protein